MAIRPLGAETALLLRSSALVVTPLSLIKELVDNAIDARASSVKVQVARNGVNQIEVQDNGAGIHQNDFSALGRRAHTSKLRAFQDLPRVGGSSLGFRGEALAAANSFAEVVITTRTAQEKVGHRIYLQPKGGGIKKHDLVPAPVGTTVRVQNLFASIPVRKKITTDNIQKTIADAKQLLQTYALARPGIRLSFGILGDNKTPWSYSPVGVPTVREAAFQVLGKDLAAQYANVTLAEPASSPANKLVEELTEHAILGIVVDAFLPQQDADLSKICRKGPFISVDGRPMAPGRGTMKKVVAAFKTRFDSFYRHQDTQSSVSNVFIQVDIRCPPGSYDINVSPAKDEVLFTDESRVLKVIDSLLEANYPITERTEVAGGSDEEELDGLLSEDLQLLEFCSIGNERSADQASSLQSPGSNSSVNLERDLGDAHHPTSSSGVEDTVSTPEEDNFEPDTTWCIDMSNSCDDDSLPQPTAASVIDQLRGAATQRGQNHGKKADAGEGPFETNPSSRATVSELQQDHTHLLGSTTPVANAPNLNPWTIAVEAAKARQQPCYDSGSFATNSAIDLENEEVDLIFPGGPGLVRSRPTFPISPSPDIHRGGVIMCTPPERMVPQTTGALQTPPSSKSRDPRQRNPLPRFKPPTMSAPQDRQLHNPRPQARPRQGQQQVEFADYELTLPEYDEPRFVNGLHLDSYMGAVDPRALEPMPEPGIPEPFGSPAFFAETNISARGVLGKNGHPPAASVGINDTKALGDGIPTTRDAAPADEPPNQHDPREYLMKRRRSMSRDRRAGRVLRRMKSVLLPLETIPTELEMHTIALIVSTGHADLRSGVFDLVHLDNYVSMGACQLRQPGLPDDLEGAAEVQTRLQTVCSEWAQRTTGRECDLRLNLCSQMKGKSCG